MQYTMIFTAVKMTNFQIKIMLFFFYLIFAQNIDSGYTLEPPKWGGSNVYTQSMLKIKNRKNNALSCKTQFYCIKVEFNGVKLSYGRVSMMLFLSPRKTIFRLVSASLGEATHDKRCM